jgi:phosphohistidine phosphatase
VPEIWFLRHGEAEPHGAAPDADRRLTEKGERQSRLAGVMLSRLGIEFAHVFTSPRARALETARLACEALGGEPIVHEPLSAGFDRDDALELLHSVGPDERILVVGHEPDFSQTIHDLTGGRIDFKKGGLAAVRVEGGGAELRVLLRPREIELAAG